VDETNGAFGCRAMFSWYDLLHIAKHFAYAFRSLTSGLAVLSNASSSPRGNGGLGCFSNSRINIQVVRDFALRRRYVGICFGRNQAASKRRPTERQSFLQTLLRFVHVRI
jgi:hypothetical protein